jgi:hypothetical protein
MFNGIHWNNKHNELADQIDLHTLAIATATGNTETNLGLTHTNLAHITDNHTNLENMYQDLENKALVSDGNGGTTGITLTPLTSTL